MLTQLTRKVDQLSLSDGGMDDNNGLRQVAEAGPSATGRYAGFGRANDSCSAARTNVVLRIVMSTITVV
jgi:hypothetical protein